MRFMCAMVARLERDDNVTISLRGSELFPCNNMAFGHSYKYLFDKFSRIQSCTSEPLFVSD